MPREEP